MNYFEQDSISQRNICPPTKTDAKVTSFIDKFIGFFWTITNGEIQIKTLKIIIEMQENIVPH